MQLLLIPIPRQPYINQLVYIILFLILIFVALTLYDTEGCVEGDGSDTPRQRAECVNACNTTWVRTFFENDTFQINPIFLMSHSLCLTVSCDVTLQCRAMGGVAVALELAGTVCWTSLIGA